MATHVNSLKDWVIPEAKVMKTVGVEVDEDELEREKRKVKMGDVELCGDQEKQLKELVGRYEDVVCMEVGKATGVRQSIETG